MIMGHANCVIHAYTAGESPEAWYTRMTAQPKIDTPHDKRKCSNMKWNRAVLSVLSVMLIRVRFGKEQG